MRMAIAMACASIVAICIVLEGAEPAKTAPLGSPEFRPSPERPIGWRGDRAGRYPAANPPLHWGRVAGSVKELRCQAAKPGEGDTGKPMQLGMISEWLLLGPLVLPEDFPKNADFRKANDAFVPDASSLRPDEGEELAGARWKKVVIGNSVIHWSELFGRDSTRTNAPAEVLAHAYVYSPSGGPVTLVGTHEGPSQVFVNGKTVFTWIAGHFHNMCARVELNKGWNSVLLKVVSLPMSGGWGWSSSGENWFSHVSFYGAGDSEYETRNIAWTSPVPDGGAISSPVIVGDRIFVTAEWCSLCCFNKADGKLLWVRSTTSCDTATEEERKAHPEVFEEIAALTAKLRQMDESLSTAVPSKENRLEVQKQIHKLMEKVDPKKYKVWTAGEPGYAAPTPVSDGRQVYVVFGTGAIVCYDLEGNRKWANWTVYDRTEHGNVNSPWVIGDRLILNTFYYESAAFDTKTGKQLWHNPPEKKKHPTMWNRGSCVTVRIGDEDFLIEPRAVVSRVSDGKRVFPGVRGGGGTIPTPVIDKGLLYALDVSLNDGSPELLIYRLPTAATEPFKVELVKTIKLDPRAFPGGGWRGYCASPLLHDGLLYLVNADGVLTVVDVAKHEIVYRKLLDADVFQAAGASRGGMASSPTLAGKYIYLFGDLGTCLVIEPGRTFKPVARNRVECFTSFHYGSQEITQSSPVFEGKRMYFRGEANLYCIEER
ncbi:MAG TPA: PQQ-binding-like beta-propeller repeat protein [Planctomycetota bacterium]|nr:PQQ-binding-like beta-propeller repeat protein [Planctomycetota bacterium]